MKLGEARLKAKQIYGADGFAVLRGIKKKICVVGFIDRTESQLGTSVDLASAASFEEAFEAADKSKANYFFTKAVERQRHYFAAVVALEQTLGFEIDATQDLSEATLDHLRSSRLVVVAPTTSRPVSFVTRKRSTANSDTQLYVGTSVAHRPHPLRPRG